MKILFITSISILFGCGLVQSMDIFDTSEPVIGATSLTFEAPKINLSPINVALLGGRFYLGPSSFSLPYWFDFDLYKQVYSKNYPNNDEELIHHYIFARNCVRTLIKRVLFRILASSENTYLDEKSDQSEDGDLIVEKWFIKDEDRKPETPYELAARLTQEEIERVESKNQLERYMEDLQSNRTVVYKKDLRNQ